MSKRHKIPVILYESEEQSIPYIEVEESDEMPKALFIQEYKHTGEFEPGNDGEEQPIVDMLMHMFVNMTFLQDKLPANLYDKVRVAIGLKPLKEARKEGEKVLKRVYDNSNKHLTEAQHQKEELKDSAAKKLNEKLTENFFKIEVTTDPIETDEE